MAKETKGTEKTRKIKEGKPAAEPKKTAVKEKSPKPRAAAATKGISGRKELNYVVGIGASAGGVEAFTELVEHLPGLSGMAFIVVQHLDPTHQSMLPDILQRKTEMQVHEARQGMVVEPDHIYVIPPNKHITIKQGKLRLFPRQSAGKFMPIDYFFGSLADDRKNLAIGVILSGTANDGTQGLRTIKQEGGLTFAQDEKSARYPDMPRNAIHAGVIDFVLSPAQISQELMRIAKHPLIVIEEEKEKEKEKEWKTGGEGEDISAIFRLLRQSSGIDFSNYKPSTIRRRIARRMVVSKVERIPDYVDRLKKSPEEQEALTSDLLINVTSFFRDPEIFDLLHENIAPDLMKRKASGTPLRVWVAGCSTGEEAYSLAMCLLESADDSLRVPIQIFATDISEWAVDRARAGIYPESIANDISKERLRRFFTRVEGGYQVAKSIRDLCVFARQDLTKDPPFSRIDLISCRNVLIYLSPVLQKKIIPTFHYALNPEGVLVLGSSETIGGFADLFALMDKKHKIYQKKQAAYRASHDFEVAEYEEKTGAVKKTRGVPTPAFDVYREADRLILASYAPASVLVNENMDILQFRGKTASYIEPLSGTASLNLVKMLREGLLLEVRALLMQARKHNVAAQKTNVAVQVDGHERLVDLDLVPVRSPESNKAHFFLILFRETVHPQPSREESKTVNRQRELRQMDQLRQDLQATREYLQSTLEEKESMSEEFRAAVEEIQSSNEELQSTNEELETAKEELQSTNEELITVNEELQNRNAELGQVNNDLMNLLNNVSFPVVMLSTDMCIRRFTPMAEKLLSLIPTDMGRPLSDLRLNILFPDLEKMINEVIDSLAAREQEVQDKDGRWYLLRVRPYMTQDKKVDGVVLVLLDIHDMKQYMEQLHQARLFADAVIQAAPSPLLVIGADLKVNVANEAFYKMFKVSPKDTEGTFLYNLGNGQWNIPQLRKQLDEILPHDTPLNNFNVEHDFPQLGRKRMVLSGRKVRFGEEEGKIVLAIEEKRADATS